MARNRTSGERQREGFWFSLKGADEAARYFATMPAQVASEVYNTFGYIGEVLRSRLSEALPMAGGEMDARTKVKGQATGKARASVVYTRSGNAANATRGGRIRVSIYPKARYVYMLGYGWSERTIKVKGGRVRSRDWRVSQTSIDASGKFRRRSVVREKGIGDGYTRRHHLLPHPIAPPVMAQYKGWIDQQIVGAINRGTREVANGSGS